MAPVGMGPRRRADLVGGVLAVVSVRRVSWWIRGAPGPPSRLYGRALLVARPRHRPTRAGARSFRRDLVAGGRRIHSGDRDAGVTRCVFDRFPIPTEAPLGRTEPDVALLVL